MGPHWSFMERSHTRNDHDETSFGWLDTAQEHAFCEQSSLQIVDVFRMGVSAGTLQHCDVGNMPGKTERGWMNSQLNPSRLLQLTTELYIFRGRCMQGLPRL